MAPFLIACTRTVHFPPAEVQALRPLAGAQGGPEGLGATLVTGAGEAVGLVEPGARVVLQGDDRVVVDGRTELTLETGGREIDFEPRDLVFAPSDLWIGPRGTLRVPYPDIRGLTLEKFSFGRTLLWTAVIAGVILLTLTIVALAVGGGDGSHHHDVFDD